MLTPGQLPVSLHTPPSRTNSKPLPQPGQAQSYYSPPSSPPPLPHANSDGAPYHIHHAPFDANFPSAHPYAADGPQALMSASGPSMSPRAPAFHGHHYPAHNHISLAFPEPQLVHPPFRHAHTSPVPTLPPKPASLFAPPGVERKLSASWLSLAPTPVEPSLAAAWDVPRQTGSPKPMLPPKPGDFTPPSEQEEQEEEDDDDDELRRVLEISMREDELQKQQAAQREEDELARALEQSLRMTHGFPGGFDRAYEDVAEDSSNSVAGSPASASRSTASLVEVPSPRSSRSSSSAHMPYANGSLSHPASPRRSSNTSLSRGPAPPPIPENGGALACTIPQNIPHVDDALMTARPLDVAPPLQAPLAQSAPTRSLPAFLQYSPDPTADMSNSTMPAAPPMGRSVSADPMMSLHAPQLAASNSGASDDMLDSPSVDAAESAANKVIMKDSSPALGDQYIDPDLLMGVELGQGVPSISPVMGKLDPLPGVIQLPYGAHAPFFIRAPSWRGLLKLMASLRRTRIEPSVQAIFDSKSPPTLRVVVCFVKVHSGSNEWLTVLFMSLDQPVPAQLQIKFRSGDTTALPYSFSLGSPLPLLHDGADAAMSKYYTIPSTHRAYLPLPTDFPTIASYLADAVDISRNAPAGESALGLRRLAKMVDAFYPLDAPLADAHPGRFGGGVGHKLLGMMGMKRKHDRDRNAETYQLVTPFVPDEFGR